MAMRSIYTNRLCDYGVIMYVEIFKTGDYWYSATLTAEYKGMSVRSKEPVSSYSIIADLICQDRFRLCMDVVNLVRERMGETVACELLIDLYKEGLLKDRTEGEGEAGQVERSATEE